MTQLHPDRETGLADQEEKLDDAKVTTERTTERTTSEPTGGDGGGDEEDDNS